MNKETFFFTLFAIWYFSHYGIHKNVLIMLMRIYKTLIEKFNESYSHLWFINVTRGAFKNQN
jgi:hypothetical protein